MPVERGKDSVGPFYRYGKHGKKYRYIAGHTTLRKIAEKEAKLQEKAVHAQAGDGIVDDVVDAGKAVINKLTNNKLDNVIEQDALLIPSVVREFFKKKGDKTITSIAECREPINKVYQFVMKLITGGKITNNLKKLKYDDLFHLYCILKLSDGSTYRVERNQRLTIQPGEPTNGKCTAFIPCNIEVKTFFENAKKAAGGWNKIFLYDPINNNCQDFQILLLKSNNLLTPQLQAFVKQDTANALKNTPVLYNAIKAVVGGVGLVESLFSN